MLTRINVFALSAVFLLYTFGALQAHSLYILPAGNDFQPARPIVSLADHSKILIANTRGAPFSNEKLNSTNDRAGRTGFAHLFEHMMFGTPKGPTARGLQTNVSGSRNTSGTRISKSPSRAQTAENAKRDVRSVQKVLLAANARRKLLALQARYIKRTGKPLIITSGQRTPATQAKVIRNNLRRYGVAQVLTTYHYSPAIRAVVSAYKANRRRPQKALREMTKVIQGQVARGVNISQHMLGQAVDIRSRGRNGARLLVLRQVAQSVGATVLVEKDHYHITLG